MKKFKLRNIHLYDVIRGIIVIFLLFLSGNISFLENGFCYTFDYCTFKATEKHKTALEIYCQFTNADISFIKKEDVFISNLEFTAALYDSDDNFIEEASMDYVIKKDEYKETLSDYIANLVQFNFSLFPDNYKLKLLLSDKNSKRMYKIEGDIDVCKMSTDELTLSGIQIASKIESSDEETIMVKNGKKIFTNVGRTFGYNRPIAHFYFEIYNLDIDTLNRENSFTFSYFIKDEDGEIVKEYANSYEKPFQDSALNFYISTSTFRGGEYIVEVKIIDNDTNQAVEQRTTFYMSRSPLDLNFTSYDHVIKLLSLVADSKVLNELKKVSKEDRKKAIADFWKSKDPTPETFKNELMEEFFYRVTIANKQFTCLGREGWCTDRGKIYIKYGRPDKIDKSTDWNTWKQYEVWEYYKIGQKKFVFLDRFGAGDYQLTTHWR